MEGEGEEMKVEKEEGMGVEEEKCECQKNVEFCISGAQIRTETASEGKGQDTENCVEGRTRKEEQVASLLSQLSKYWNSSKATSVPDVNSPVNVPSV